MAYFKEERCAGNTFRKLLMALVSASEGKMVEYMCATENSAIAHARKAKAVVNLLTEDINSNSFCIYFPNDGRLLFIAEEGSPKPKEGTIVFNDY